MAVSLIMLLISWKRYCYVPASKAMKKRSERCKHCALAVVRRSQKNFAPPQTPFPGAQDGQNLISWRWSLPLPTNPVFWWGSMHAISSYRGNRPTPTHKQRPSARCKLTGPITIHCTAASAQCNQVSANVSTLWRNVSHRACHEYRVLPMSRLFCLISRNARVHDFCVVYFAPA